MEISGAVLRRNPAVSVSPSLRNSGRPALTCSSTVGFGRRASVSARPIGGSAASGGGGAVFADVGHLNYYASLVRSGEGKRKKKEQKKRAKLVKGLSRDLTTLFALGIGVDAGEGVAGEVKGKMISEAAEILLAELEQMRAQQKEMKRKRKAEKSAMKAARAKQHAMAESSSSSSSESSDSERDEVVKMGTFRAAAVQEPKLEDLAIPSAEAECSPRPSTLEPKAPKPAQGCCGTGSGACVGCCNKSSRTSSSTSGVGKPMNKIEVCMGGKCRRSGAAELMEEFEKRIGVEVAVVGCKCMGKCRDGPNVRVLDRSNGHGQEAVSVPKNPLCIGVGLEDVGTIVSNFFGQESLGLVAA
ncbi:hypothetical protein OPV22_028132 [Ensete ventricosum]|uniref:Uncharacterized protein n=1 Tax=Ensete ventricosum TaxID=4639 RepID=A0AAV8Q1U1_ENSVE|nr:hypothetical protein OPV22_028132 [Ensete ventricosum]